MESRLKNYLGPTYYRPSVVEMEEMEENQRPWIYMYSDFIGTEFPINNTLYYHDMTRYIHGTPSLYHQPFLFYPRDRVEAFRVPTLVKSRPIHERGESILLNLNYKRHFEEVFNVDTHDIPYEEKKDILVWRGATTGYGFGNNIPYRETSREDLVTMYHDSSSPHIDIALSPINNTEKQSYGKFARENIPLKDLLRYKFVISIEGNDVATNLKWLLYSNSVPFCPPFTMQSWILEDQLEPWRHYIPLRADLTDLEDKIEWALNHHHQCREIAKEGRQYMAPFLDIRQERTIVKNILDIYANNVRIIT